MNKYFIILACLFIGSPGYGQKKSKLFLSDDEITTYTSEKEFYEAMAKLKVGDGKKRDYFTVINKLMKEPGNTFEEKLSYLDSALKVFEMLVIRNNNNPDHPEKLKKSYKQKLLEIQRTLAVQYKSNGNYA